MMWKYTKCTAGNRAEELKKLAAAFHEELDCLKYLSEVQNHINSTQTTIVLLQDIDESILIEMDYIPVNNYAFHVVSIDDNGIRREGLPCKSIEQAVMQFMAQVRT